jgi:serine/threonine protein kinase/CheY-like chemotaxis protein
MKPKVLLVESNVNSGTVLRSYLEKHDFEVWLEKDLSGAYERLTGDEPTLLVADLDNTDLAWSEFFGWLRQHSSNPAIPCLMIASQQNELSRSLSAYAQVVFLQKPLKRRIFLEEIRGLLARFVPSFTAETELLKSKGEVPVSDNSFLETWSRSLRGRKLGSVILEQEIGRGGMGVVWLGTQVSLNRKVAVKILLPQMTQDASTIKRFKREALETAKLKSPHIVQIYEAGTTDEHLFYIVMEWLDGRNLEQLLHRHRRFDIEDAIDIVQQTARGLQVAHDAGLIHRDLKPSNLILSETGHVTITDFGIVLNRDASRYTQTGSVMGTPYYMSPEQARSRKITEHSDLYSLGILFFELLTGQLPFFTPNLLDLLLAHTNTPLPNPQKLIPQIPDELVEVLNKMTAKLPDDRYSSAAEVVAALERVKSLGPFAEGRFLSDESSPASAELSLPLETELLEFATETPEPVSRAQRAAYISPATLNRLLKTLDISTLTPDTAEWVDWGLRDLMEMDWDGSLWRQEGESDPNWSIALSILLGHEQQIQTAVVFGEWQYSSLTTEEAEFFLRPTEDGVLSFLREPAPHSTSSLFAGELYLDPGHLSRLLPSLYALAGVTNVFLLDSNAQLLDARLEPDMDVGDLQLKLGPMIHTLQALPWPIVQLQARFRDGVMRFWSFGQTVLCVHTLAQCNQSLLSMMVKRQLTTAPGSEETTSALEHSFVAETPSTQLSISNQPSEEVVWNAPESDNQELFVQTPPRALDSSNFHQSQPIQTPSRLTGRFTTSSLEFPTEGLLSEEVFDALLQEYTSYAGPIARIVVNGAMSSLGFGREHFPMAQLGSLLEQMASRITLEKQSTFLRECHRIVHQYEGTTRR